MVPERCLCGVHVHKGTLIVAIVCLIGNLIVIGSSLFQLIAGKTNETIPYANATHNSSSYDKMYEIYNKYVNSMPIVNFVVGLLVLILILLLIYGNRARKPQFYRPFLYLMIVDIVLGALIVVLAIIAAIVAFASPSTFGLKPDEASGLGVAYLIIALVLGVVYLLHFYFYYLVVNRSKNLLIEEELAAQVGTNPDIFNKQPVV